jgi:hypothetical protein
MLRTTSPSCPKAEHDAPEWQAAMETLLLVAEHDGPTMFARIGIMRALNRHVERVFDSSRKETHWESASWRATGDGCCGDCTVDKNKSRVSPKDDPALI